MADLSFHAGFETGGLEEWDTTYGSPSVVAAAACTGNYGMRATSVANYVEKTIAGGGSQASLRFKIDSLPSSGYVRVGSFILLYGASTTGPTLGIDINSNGSVTCGGQTSSSGLISGGTWYRISGCVYNDGANKSEIYLDGVSILTSTATFQSGTDCLINSGWVNNGTGVSSVDVDDVINGGDWALSSPVDIGDIRVLAARPNAEGTDQDVYSVNSNAWADSTGSADASYAEVDNTPPNTTALNSSIGDGSNYRYSVALRDFGDLRDGVYYVRDGDVNGQIYGNNWTAQSFVATKSRDCAGVLLRMGSSGSPSDLIVGLRAVDGSGKPTGGDLASVTISSMPSADSEHEGYYQLTFTVPYGLTQGSDYCIVLRSPSSDSSNYWTNYYSTSSSYADGGKIDSTDGGSSWGTPSTTDDHNMVIFCSTDASDTIEAVNFLWYYATDAGGSNDYGIRIRCSDDPGGTPTDDDNIDDPKDPTWLAAYHADTPGGGNAWTQAYFNSLEMGVATISCSGKDMFFYEAYAMVAYKVVGGGVTEALSGQVSIVTTVTGTLKVSKPLSGTAAIAIDSTGALARARPLSGAIAMTINTSGDLVVVIGIAGQIDITTSVIGAVQITRGLSGQSDVVVSVVGTLIVVRGLSGQLDSAVAISGALYRTRSIAGQVEVIIAALGNLTRSQSLVGTIAISATTTAVLSRTRGLSGTVTSTVGVVGSLVVVRGLSGQSDLFVAITGALSRSRNLSGTVAIAVLCSGTLQTGGEITLSGAVAIAITTSGAIYCSRKLVGQIDVAIAAAGTLTTQGQVLLVGQTGVAVGVSGSLSVARKLTGQVDVAIGVVGILLRSRSLSGQVDLAIAVVGELSIVTSLAGQIDVSVGVSGLLTLTRGLSGQTAVAAAVVGTAIVDRNLSGQSAWAIQCQGNLTTLGAVTYDLQSSVEGTVAVVGSLMNLQELSGVVNVQVSVTGDLTVTVPVTPLSGAVAAAIVLSADLSRTRSIVGQSQISVALVADLSRIRTLLGTTNIAISVVGTLTTQGEILLHGRCDVAVGLSGNLVVARSLSGAVVTAIGLSADLSCMRSLSGQSDVVTSLVANLVCARYLAGQIDTAVAVAGVLTTQGELLLSGQSGIAIGLIGNLVVTRSLVGAAQMAVSLSANLTVGGELFLQGSAAVAVGLTGSLERQYLLAGAVQITVATVGIIVRTVQIDGSTQTVIVVGSPNLLRQRALVGTFDVMTAVLGHLTLDWALQGAILVEIDVGGTLSGMIKPGWLLPVNVGNLNSVTTRM